MINGAVKQKKHSLVLISVLILSFLFSTGNGFAQSKSEKLKLKRQKLEKEIAYTNKLLKEVRKNKKNTLYELQLLQNKIAQRNELIATLKKEIANLNKQISTKRSDINVMDDNLEQLKKDYAKILLFLSKHNNNLDKLVFIFSAEDLNQAYQRLRYMNEMMNYIKRQSDTIVNYENLRKEELQNLTKQKEEKNKLLKKESEQLEKIEQNLKEKDRIKNILAKKERQLKTRIRQKQKEASKLNKEIERTIAKEIAAAKAKEKHGGSKTETITYSGNFYKEKGKLPWPVDNGFISQHFGSHPHPVLKHVTINNNGIDIATSKGSVAKAVFGGKVVGVAQISNSNNAVIVKHGNWFTVYSNLEQVYVKRGDNVNMGTPIGKIHTNIKGKTELHFEVWYGKKKQNPEYWIKRK